MWSPRRRGTGLSALNATSRPSSSAKCRAFRLLPPLGRRPPFFGGPGPVHHAFELHAIRIGEEHGVIVLVAVVLAGRIEHRHAVLVEESAEIVDILAARQLERIVVEADVALAVLVLAAFCIGLGDPE